MSPLPSLFSQKPPQASIARTSPILPYHTNTTPIQRCDFHPCNQEPSPLAYKTSTKNPAACFQRDSVERNTVSYSLLIWPDHSLLVFRSKSCIFSISFWFSAFNSAIIARMILTSFSFLWELGVCIVCPPFLNG